MKEIDNVLYYTTTDVAKAIGKSQQTIWLWDKYSKELEAQNRPRLIPKPLVIGRKRLFTEEQLQEIADFSNYIQRGDLVEFSRRQWGKEENL